MIDWIQVLFSLGAGLAGGITAIIGYRLFKQKTELQLEGLVAANELQLKNNELQQKKIDNQDRDILQLRERFHAHRERYEDFTKQSLDELAKVDTALLENTQAITGLKATMEGLKNVFEMMMKNNGK